MRELFTFYCIDTSALITMWQYHYPISVFPSLWDKIDFHIKQGEILIPSEVYEELRTGGDNLFEWIKERKARIVKELDEEQVKIVFKIEAKFPNLIDKNKTKPDADPFVIALAYQKNWKVVTTEIFSQNPNKPKIPNVCEHYKITCLNIVEFFKDLNFKI